MTKGFNQAWRGINMSPVKLSRLLFLCLLMAVSQHAWSEDYFGTYAKMWTLKRLFNPSARQLKMEQHQKIFTYIGLTDKQLDAAMDENFDRIQSFMIANVIVTDENGKPKHNTETGEVITEDDGC
jgi:hypothetical protein